MVLPFFRTFLLRGATVISTHTSPSSFSVLVLSPNLPRMLSKVRRCRPRPVVRIDENDFNGGDTSGGSDDVDFDDVDFDDKRDGLF